MSKVFSTIHRLLSIFEFYRLHVLATFDENFKTANWAYTYWTPGCVCQNVPVSPVMLQASESDNQHICIV